MPDQSAAASEQSIIDELVAPLEKLPDDPVPVVADVDFPLALRGYSRDAVDAYVQRASRLVAELHATRSPEVAVRRALERVGGEVSGVLQRAHEVADQITTQSRREAEERREAARQEARQITADAKRLVQDLDADADRLWEERERLLEDVRELANELLRVASDAARRLPAEEAEPQDDGAQEAVTSKADAWGEPMEERAPSDHGEEQSPAGADERDANVAEVGEEPLPDEAHEEQSPVEEAYHQDANVAEVGEEPLLDEAYEEPPVEDAYEE